MSIPSRTHLAGPTVGGPAANSSGFGRPTTPQAESVSEHLRRGDTRYLRHRRRVAALSLGGAASLGVVAAYQFGLVRHLPEPPLPLLDADRVDASGEAFRFLATPDAALGVLSYAATLVLAGVGTATRHEDRPLVPLALAAKVGLDAAAGLLLTVEQASRHRRFCSYCLMAAGTSVAALPQVMPEAGAAGRVLWRRLRARRCRRGILGT